MCDHKKQSRLFGLALAAVLAGLTMLGTVQPALAEETVPEASIFDEVALEGNPKNLVLESDSRTWYTLPAIDKLALVTGGTATYYPVDTDGVNNSQPYDLVINNNAVWFTMLSANRIGKLDIATGNVTSYPVPTADSEPTGITFGGGYIWFVQRKGDKLGRLDPANGSIVEYYDWLWDPNTDKNLLNMKGAELEDVVYVNGDVWFTGPKLDRAGAGLYNVANGTWAGSPPPGAGSEPMQMATDSLNNVWVTFRGLNLIGRSALNTLQTWDPFPLPAGTGGPVGLYVREANGLRELWYTRPDANRMGRLTTRPNGTAVSTWETDLPIANAAPWGIAATPTGSAIVATANTAKTVVWNSPFYTFFLRLPLLSKSE
jgi:streptogramin lyase